jgi:hypothetical protein
MLGECGVYFDPVRRHPINKKYFIDAIGGNGRAEFLLEVHLDPIRKVLPKNGTPLMPVYSTPVAVRTLECSLKTFVVNLLPEKYKIKAKELYHVSITYFKNKFLIIKKRNLYKFVLYYVHNSIGPFPMEFFKRPTHSLNAILVEIVSFACVLYMPSLRVLKDTLGP